MGGNWFVTGGTRRIDLPGGEWIEVRDVLTYGEQRQLDAATVRVQVALGRGEPDVAVDLKRHALTRLLLYLVDWSLTLPDGSPAPIDEATIEKLHPAKARLIEEALDRHVAAMEAEARAQSEAPGTTSSQAGQGGMAAGREGVVLPFPHTPPTGAGGGG